MYLHADICEDVRDLLTGQDDCENFCDDNYCPDACAQLYANSGQGGGDGDGEGGKTCKLHHCGFRTMV